MNKVLTIFLTLLIICSSGYSQIRDAQVNLYAIPTLSTAFVRMPSRSASQEIDAVYNNPAGVMSLSNGFHLNVTNQFQWIDQSLNIDRYKQIPGGAQEYPFIVKNYAFPIFTGAYVKNKFAFAFMAAPAIGGGGSSSLTNLPFAEFPIADFAALTQGIIDLTVDNPHHTNYDDFDYSYDFDFSGLSYSPFGQVGMAYEINKYISVAAGVRFLFYIVDARGSLSNIRFTNDELGISLSPGDYVRYIVENEDVQYPELGLLLADLADILPFDLEIEARQTDFAFTPYFGVNFNWKDRWYAGFKFEPKTKVNLITNVIDGKDGSGAYVQDKQQRADMPGQLNLGAQFVPNNKISVAFHNRSVFHKRINIDGREDFVISNAAEYNAALEFRVLPRLRYSIGGGYRTLKVEDEYYTSIDYFLPSFTFGTGFKADINKRMAVEAGLIYTKYITQNYRQDVEIFGGLAPLLLGDELPDVINDNFSRNVQFEMGGQVFYASVGVDFWMGSIEENKIAREERTNKLRYERKEFQNKRQKRRELRREERPGIKEHRQRIRTDWLERRSRFKEERRHEFPVEPETE